MALPASLAQAVATEQVRGRKAKNSLRAPSANASSPHPEEPQSGVSKDED
jgi:hypothetical protein